MNAKEKIKAVMACASIEEVKEMLTDETRKTVLDAGEERIGELTMDSNSAPEEKSAPEAPKAPKAPKVKEPSVEENRIADFKRKTQHFIPCKNIVKFAEDYFGKEIKSIDTKDCMVTIKLVSGASFTQRGN